MRSALYEGTVRHRRFAVRERSFTHRLAMAYVDLDEVDDLLGGALVRRRPGLVRFRRGDYLGDPRVPLAESVRGLLAERLGADAGRDRPIRLLTQLRSFGHCFNPVSFYYCFGSDDERLDAIVAEVTNTPWGDRHAYVLPRTEKGPVLRGTLDKRLHVSPFMGMDQRYTVAGTVPAETLSVHIESAEDGRRVFDATIKLRRRPFTRRGLIEVTARHPAATLGTLALIYGHALGLKLAGVPIRRRPS